MILQIALPLSLAIIMFSMGLSLTVDDFIRVKKFPKAFLSGLVLQMLALPLIAFGLCFLWTNFADVSPAILVGFILIAACPGGVTSNMFAHLAKGDTALSISLTAIISVLSVFSIPIILNYGLQVFMGESGQQSLPIGKTIIGVFVITTVPVVLGMLIKALGPKLAVRLEPKVKKVASGLFIIIVGAAIIKEWGLIVENFSHVGPITILLNLLSMTLAYVVSKKLLLKEAQVRSIVFECGLQNGTLAVTIALTIIGNEAMMIPGALYSILMFFSGGFYFWKIRQSSSAQ